MVTIKDVAQGMPEKEEYYYRMAEQNKVDGIISNLYEKVQILYGSFVKQPLSL